MTLFSGWKLRVCQNNPSISTSHEKPFIEEKRLSFHFLTAAIDVQECQQILKSLGEGVERMEEGNDLDKKYFTPE